MDQSPLKWLSTDDFEPIETIAALGFFIRNESILVIRKQPIPQ